MRRRPDILDIVTIVGVGDAGPCRCGDVAVVSHAVAVVGLAGLILRDRWHVALAVSGWDVARQCDTRAVQDRGAVGGRERVKRLKVDLFEQSAGAVVEYQTVGLLVAQRHVVDTVNDGGSGEELLPLVTAQYRASRQAEETLGATLIPCGPEAERGRRAVDVGEVGEGRFVMYLRVAAKAKGEPAVEALAHSGVHDNSTGAVDARDTSSGWEQVKPEHHERDHINEHPTREAPKWEAGAYGAYALLDDAYEPLDIPHVLIVPGCVDIDTLDLVV